MSTSNTHQQSLDDAGSKTSPSMLERGSYIPWVSRFRRYLNQKRENRKWLNKVIDEGPYEFRIFTPSETEAPRMQKEEDLRGDDLKHYEAEIEAMNLISISIPNDIYALLQKLCGKELNRTLQTTSSGTATNVQCYNCSEKGHYARNCQKLRVQDLKYFIEQMLLAKQDEAGVILTDKQNDFHFADASRIEETEELRPSYDSAFLSKVQAPSTSYVNPLFAKDAQEQKYPNQPKIINNTIGDDQINSNIIFDEPNGDVNSGSVEYG
ncbi:putative reverse transcriptase domain-containing protein [Tanacetum coccineum]